ncbi:MAG TPA: carbonic anhydrase [Geminicoccus sp.]|nr:carbonic anhydrase [Geminicoccus sp.]HEX2529018.1 carbonic anhydrase [Geminicoccus sp.]
MRPSRRFLLGMGAAMLGTMAAGGPGHAVDLDDSVLAPPPNAIPADAALQRLMDGNARYAANRSTQMDYSAGRAARAKAQYPIAGIVSCADSRVAPELAFDQAPGELFVVRLAGNFVNQDGLASLEYGVEVLGIPLLMVLGHSGCGAVDATIKVIQDRIELPGHLPDLVAALKPGVQRAIDRKPDALLDAAILENVRYNMERLEDATPIVAEHVASGKVQVVGGVYDIATGKVTMV